MSSAVTPMRHREDFDQDRQTLSALMSCKVKHLVRVKVILMFDHEILFITALTDRPLVLRLMTGCSSSFVDAVGLWVRLHLLC